MELLSQILTIYNWGVVCILLFFLFNIAKFFEQRLFKKDASQKQRSFYPLLIIPFGAFALGGIIYLFEPLVVGNGLADALRLIGGGVLIFTCITLLNRMIGGRS